MAAIEDEDLNAALSVTEVLTTIMLLGINAIPCVWGFFMFAHAVLNDFAVQSRLEEDAHMQGHAEGAKIVLEGIMKGKATGSSASDGDGDDADKLVGSAEKGGAAAAMRASCARDKNRRRSG